MERINEKARHDGQACMSLSLTGAICLAVFLRMDSFRSSPGLVSHNISICLSENSYSFSISVNLALVISSPIFVYELIIRYHGTGLKSILKHMKSKSKIVPLRFRQKDRNIFEAILDGRKKVETRAATKKFSNIKAGDFVALVCGGEKVAKIVRRAEIFKTIEKMLEKYKVKDINPFLNSAEELEKMYYSFPDYRKKIKRYGLMALELE